MRTILDENPFISNGRAIVSDPEKTDDTGKSQRKYMSVSPELMQSFHNAFNNYLVQKQNKQNKEEQRIVDNSISQSFGF